MVTEEQRVKHHHSRAEKVGQIATLTLQEWEQTLRDFSGRCAYCLVRSFVLLEHYLPVEVAGTHVGNCVPACKPCNLKKSNHRGEVLKELFGVATIERVEQYLATRQSSSLATELYINIPDNKMQMIQDPKQERYYTAEEAMELLGKSRSTFFREVEDGTIPSELEEGKKRGRRYPKEAIDAHVRVNPKNRRKPYSKRKAQISNTVPELHIDMPCNESHIIQSSVKKQYYTADEAMNILKKSRSTFFREVEDGTIPSELDEGRKRGRRYPKEAIDAHVRVKPVNKSKMKLVLSTL